MPIIKQFLLRIRVGSPWWRHRCLLAKGWLRLQPSGRRAWSHVSNTSHGPNIRIGYLFFDTRRRWDRTNSIARGRNVWFAVFVAVARKLQSLLVPPRKCGRTCKSSTFQQSATEESARHCSPLIRLVWYSC